MIVYPDIPASHHLDHAQTNLLGGGVENTSTPPSWYFDQRKIGIFASVQ
jgi:hypothetical protein